MSDVQYEQVRSPFQPGFGRAPPLLAGREVEQSRLAGKLLMLQHGDAPNPDLLSAPRGMGKTVLLNWLQRQAQGKGVETVQTAAININTLPALVKLLAPDLLDEARASGWNIGGELLGTGGSLGKNRGEAFGEPPWLLLLQDALLKQRRDKPLIIAIDEAHILKPEVAVGLVNLEQLLASANCRVWLLLAGTPGLLHHLRTAGAGDPDSPDPAERLDSTASFMERADKLYPRLLTPGAAREALLIPLQERGWQVEEQALESVLADTQGYPFFLQLWGRALWEAGVERESRCLDQVTVEVAGAVVNVQREDFYSGRYRELLDSPHTGMEAAARAVVQLFEQQPEVKITALYDVIRPHVLKHRETGQIFSYLEKQGFLWNPDGDRYVPGIPSLMDYVLAQRALTSDVPGADAPAPKGREETTQRFPLTPE